MHQWQWNELLVSRCFMNIQEFQYAVQVSFRANIADFDRQWCGLPRVSEGFVPLLFEAHSGKRDLQCGVAALDFEVTEVHRSMLSVSCLCGLTLAP